MNYTCRYSILLMNYPAAELRSIKSPLSASLKLSTFPP